MTKQELRIAVDAAREETRMALQTVYDAMNQGQQQKLLKEDGVRALLDRYCVDYKQ